MRNVITSLMYISIAST